MGITTRGGIAHTLEYDKNDALISEKESHNRIIFILLIFCIMFCLSLKFIILLIIHVINKGKQINIKLLVFWNTVVFALVPSCF